MRAILALGVAALLLVAGCAPEGPAGRQYEVADARRITLDSPGQLTIVPGDAGLLTIDTDEQGYQYLTVNMTSDRLTISFDDSYAEPSRILMTLEVPTVTLLSVVGEGTIEAEGPLASDDMLVEVPGTGTVRIAELAGERLEVEIAGSGTVEIGGTCERQEVLIAGTGLYRAGALESSEASDTIGGSGAATVWVEDRLAVDLVSNGSVDYYGDPELDANTPGGGTVRSRGER